MNRDTTRWGPIRIVLLGALACTSQAGWCIQVGSNELNPKSELSANYMESINGWLFGSADNPVDVTLDDTAGPLVKTLNGSPGGADGLTFTMHEFIKIDGGQPWVDWHEQLTTEGWAWNSGTISVNGQVVSTGQVEGGDGLLMAFDFNQPLADGTVIEIWKNITYVGVPTHHEQWPGAPVVIQVFEHPDGSANETMVPEPATMSLLGIGMGTAFLFRSGASLRRKRRKADLKA